MSDTAQRSFSITTAISYPNGMPHIGHAYEVIATDAIARFKRLDGYDVQFTTGTDEHGLKIQQAATRAGTTPRAFVDDMAARFKGMADALNCSYDRFIRTTEPEHYAAVQEVWRRMEANGDIYLAKYSGWYSVRDEAYFDEAETVLQPDGTRRTLKTDTPVEWMEEENFLFRLSAYEDRLLKLYAEQPDFVGPDTRMNEVASFVRGGLKDLSISRTTFDWGVPVPGHPAHVMYVWIDALTNYLTVTGFPDETDPRKKYWPADLHVIGKDIVRFHAVYWPAFLMSAGLPLPRRVFGHGFLLSKGEKMSKSLGNVVDPMDLVSTYGVDPVRYFCLREVPFGGDGSYSHEAIINRINADLANDLGNLAQRSLSMIAKNCEGAVPEAGAFTQADQTLLAAAAALPETARGLMKDLALHQILAEIWTVVADANRYFASEEPWRLKKSDPARMNTVLYVTVETLRRVGILVQPFVPNAAGVLLDLLAVPVQARLFAQVGEAHRLQAGTPLPAPSPIFPRFEKPEAA
ncbi:MULTISPECIES: methionine--tRNA ligase [Methylobacterium]|uniref:Methionine--tRNA ligase n=1 Tax=Methylobacterium thuringiense TaxID=1003091 RepID=A0ABQ4TPF9_9HYPH|nr:MULTISPECIES: methionine--tRNA ligase [Methylobacterium]TXN19800.1 methionine--tRNA ligase [Methylobacterium sp. WL9]GJE56002.1 Methionine--tRNA ligase [Methylobacterium thuringiense]